MAASSTTPSYSTPRSTYQEMHSYLDVVAACFTANKSANWRGEWFVTQEAASVPHALWVDVSLQMASHTRFLRWTAAAKVHGKQVEDMFPVSNSPTVLPKPSIEDQLCGSTAYSRADLLLGVRILKVIEQLVLSRTNGVAGPLTISVSVSGSCEVTASFVSVLKSMGLFLSYTVTERYRQKLIAERERVGPWDFNLVDEVAVPVLQFDNWDIKTLYAVKVDGKALPKVNGSLLQAQLRGKKSSFSEQDTAQIPEFGEGAALP